MSPCSGTKHYSLAIGGHSRKISPGGSKLVVAGRSMPSISERRPRPALSSPGRWPSRLREQRLERVRFAATSLSTALDFLEWRRPYVRRWLRVWPVVDRDRALALLDSVRAALADLDRYAA